MKPAHETAYSYLKFERPEDHERFERNGAADWRNNLSLSVLRFERLLAQKPGEQKVHEFLELHPYLLPGFGDLHHGPYAHIIATKFPLGNDHVTDFAYICSNSQTLYLTCVEIESPKKKLFRKDGKFHRDYIDARQQIVDWLAWAQRHKRQAFDCWGKLFGSTRLTHFDISFRAFLVFGRRSDIDDGVKQERWSAEAHSLVPGLQVMTYDRLLKLRVPIYYDVDNERIAVCSYRDRRFYAKHVVG